MSVIGRYYRTVMRLRPRQIWTRASRRIFRPRADTRPHPERRTPSSRLVRPIAQRDGWRTPTLVRLLNLDRDFEGGIEWRPSDMPRLWVYTLNYFDDLPQTAAASAQDGGIDAAQAARLIEHWMEANPPGRRVAWDPYPISMRSVNWIKWMLLLDQSGGLRTVIDPDPVLNSLAAQLRFLEKRLEFDNMANHLLANAVALTAGGLFFGGIEGNRWVATGLALLDRQLSEQVKDDGGHFERSPMYHSVVLEQFLDVLNLWSVFPDAVPSSRRVLRDRLSEAVPRMLRWLGAMTHPDGMPAFFNDTTAGSSSSYTDLVEYAQRLGFSLEPDEFPLVHWLQSTGFFRLSSGDGRSVVLFDAGSPAPRYQPGHAHSESLSFEVSRGGRRLFVNSGISTYVPGHQRLWQRLTAAHNTVRIDEEDQSELWASHRCGRRARISQAGERRGWAFAEHTGYRFLPGNPRHLRKLRVTDEGLEIVDNITGDGEHLLEWYFHLHPDTGVRVFKDRVELSLDALPVAAVKLPFGASPLLETGSWHPGFNISLPNTTLHVAVRASLPFEFITTVEWL